MRNVSLLGGWNGSDVKEVDISVDEISYVNDSDNVLDDNLYERSRMIWTLLLPRGYPTDENS